MYNDRKMHKESVVAKFQILDRQHSVRFEVFTAVTMKNAVFWDITPCGSCNRSRRRLLVTANVVPS
jgi:hypothetical protein